MSVVFLVSRRTDDCDRFRSILSKEGYALQDISETRELDRLIQTLRPLALIVATDFPGEVCLDLCRRLRRVRDDTILPILLVVNAEDDPAILEALGVDVDDYVTRSSPAEVALSRLRRLIRDRQLAMSARINEQLAQVGRLLTGIIHEIRTPLTVIRGQAELLRMTIGDGDELSRFVEPIVRNAQLMQSRLDHLMAAVRGGPPTLEPIDINELVEEVSALFQKGMDPQRHGVCLELERHENLPAVYADAGRLIQVLMNLLANAREAIQQAGRAGRIRMRTRLARDHDQSWVLIEVEDDGPGIAEEQLDRVFEPFFTTKPEGTGYGLYLAGEILREHGGRVTACKSALGGAGLTIWLPVAPAANTSPT